MQIIIVLILLIVFFYLALIYFSMPLVMLFFFAVVYVIVSCVFLLIYKHHLDCKMLVPIAVTDEGGTVPVEFIVQRRMPLGSPRLRFAVVVRNTFTGKRTRMHVKVQAVGRKQETFRQELVLPEAGSYEILLKRVRLYDVAGLLHVNCHRRDRASLQVLPSVHNLPVEISQGVRRFYGESDVYDDRQAGYDYTESAGFRPFAAGDRLQQIHWKLSAKSDELMVRESSMPKACAVVLFLDDQSEAETSAAIHTMKKQNRKRKAATKKIPENAKSQHRKKRGKRSGRHDRMGLYLQMAASLSYSLMDEGCPHYVAWYDGKEQDVVRIRVDDEESFFAFLAGYIVEPDAGQGQNRSLPERYEEKYRTEHYLYALRLTRDAVLYKNEQEIFRAGAKQTIQDFEEVPILL